MNDAEVANREERKGTLHSYFQISSARNKSTDGALEIDRSASASKMNAASKEMLSNSLQSFEERKRALLGDRYVPPSMAPPRSAPPVSSTAVALPVEEHDTPAFLPTTTTTAEPGDAEETPPPPAPTPATWRSRRTVSAECLAALNASVSNILEACPAPDYSNTFDDPPAELHENVWTAVDATPKLASTATTHSNRSADEEQSGAFFGAIKDRRRVLTECFDANVAASALVNVIGSDANSDSSKMLETHSIESVCERIVDALQLWNTHHRSPLFNFVYLMCNSAIRSVSRLKQRSGGALELPALLDRWMQYARWSCAYIRFLYEHHRRTLHALVLVFVMYMNVRDMPTTKKRKLLYQSYDAQHKRIRTLLAHVNADDQDQKVIDFVHLQSHSKSKETSLAQLEHKDGAKPSVRRTRKKKSTGNDDDGGGDSKTAPGKHYRYWCIRRCSGRYVYMNYIPLERLATVPLLELLSEYVLRVHEAGTSPCCKLAYALVEQLQKNT